MGFLIDLFWKNEYYSKAGILTNVAGLNEDNFLEWFHTSELY